MYEAPSPDKNLVAPPNLEKSPLQLFIPSSPKNYSPPPLDKMF